MKTQKWIMMVGGLVLGVLTGLVTMQYVSAREAHLPQDLVAWAHCEAPFDGTTVQMTFFWNPDQKENGRVWVDHRYLGEEKEARLRPVTAVVASRGGRKIEVASQGVPLSFVIGRGKTTFVYDVTTMTCESTL
jgi:hypothetical protein